MRVAHMGVMLIVMIMLSVSYAGVRVYYQPQQTVFTSQPETVSGFSYSDGFGNSISVNQKQYMPVIVQQYPNALWVYMTNGRIPPNAIVVQYINGYPSYSCRVQTNDGIFYGLIVFNEGCAVPEYPQTIFSTYGVLSR